MKRRDLLTVAALIGMADFSKLGREAMQPALRNLRALRPINEDWEKTVRELAARSPEKSGIEIESEANAIHNDALDEELPVELERLTDDGAAELVASIKGITGTGALLLMDAVGPIPDKEE